MRYLSVYYGPQDNHDIDPKKQEALGKLIAEMSQAGVFLGTEGCAPTSEGFRLRRVDGKLAVTDGPFAETKEVLGGYCMLEVKSKAEAVEWGRRFMAIMGEGYTETRLIMGSTPAK